MHVKNRAIFTITVSNDLAFIPYSIVDNAVKYHVRAVVQSTSGSRLLKFKHFFRRSPEVGDHGILKYLLLKHINIKNTMRNRLGRQIKNYCVGRL